MGDWETAMMMAGAEGAEHAIVEYHKLSMIANIDGRTNAKLWQQGKSNGDITVQSLTENNYHRTNHRTW